MTGLVWTLVLTLLSFTATVVVCNINGIQIQDSIVTGFVAAVTGELATMGGIKIFKVKGKKTESDGDSDG